MQLHGMITHMPMLTQHYKEMVKSPGLGVKQSWDPILILPLVNCMASYKERVKVDWTAGRERKKGEDIGSSVE